MASLPTDGEKSRQGERQPEAGGTEWLSLEAESWSQSCSLKYLKKNGRSFLSPFPHLGVTACPAVTLVVLLAWADTSRTLFRLVGLVRLVPLAVRLVRLVPLLPLLPLVELVPESSQVKLWPVVAHCVSLHHCASHNRDRTKVLHYFHVIMHWD